MSTNPSRSRHGAVGHALRSVPLVAIAVATACGWHEQNAVPVPIVTAAYEDSAAEFPRLRYSDGQVSLNDRCMVRHARLSLKLPPTYVNGRAVGFC